MSKALHQAGFIQESTPSRSTLRVVVISLLLLCACGSNDTEPAEQRSDVQDVHEARTGDTPPEALDVASEVADFPEVAEPPPDEPETLDIAPAELCDEDQEEADAWIEPLDGFGALDGACGVLDDGEWGSEGPFFFLNHIDFGDDPYDDGDLTLLSAGGQAIVEAGNAGGSSLMSEVFAYEVLYRCEAAALLKTETEINYVNPQGKITDLLVSLDERKIGVSVTRAVAWPFDEPYPAEEASALLEKKLQGVLDSSANVAAEDAWVRQILHVMAYGPQHAEELETAWGALPDTLRADTIVIVTVTDGDDGFLY